MFLDIFQQEAQSTCSYALHVKYLEKLILLFQHSGFAQIKYLFLVRTLFLSLARLRVKNWHIKPLDATPNIEGKQICVSEVCTITMWFMKVCRILRAHEHQCV